MLFAGISLFQGYLFARPEVERFLSKAEINIAE